MQLEKVKKRNNLGLPTMRDVRGTLYNPDHCNQVITIASTGKTMSKFCAMIGISWQRFLEWQEKDADFAEAVGIADMILLDRWEDLAERVANGDQGKDANGQVLKFVMENRFPEHYAKIKVMEKRGPAVQNVVFNINTGIDTNKKAFVENIHYEVLRETAFVKSEDIVVEEKDSDLL